MKMPVFAVADVIHVWIHYLVDEWLVANQYVIRLQIIENESHLVNLFEACHKLYAYLDYSLQTQFVQE